MKAKLLGEQHEREQLPRLHQIELREVLVARLFDQGGIDGVVDDTVGIDVAPPHGKRDLETIGMLGRIGHEDRLG